MSACSKRFWQLGTGTEGLPSKDTEKLTVPPGPPGVSTALAARALPTSAGLGRMTTFRFVGYFT
jgi:hypothetical protein